VYDVFLSYSRSDKRMVELLASKLVSEAGLEPFLDKWHLVPGEKWQTGIDTAIHESKTAAVFIGSAGLSSWHHEEMQAALIEAVRTRNEYRVIPVLLPGAVEEAITGFLKLRTWVDFRSGLDGEEAFQRLVYGIRGKARPHEPFTLPEEPPPYRGLYPFEEKHASIFFGRAREVDAVLQKLEHSNFVAVVGASGAGKSSLIRAGVLPKLGQRMSWPKPIHTTVLTPGADPLRSVADHVVSLLLPNALVGDLLANAKSLEQEMLEGNDGLHKALRTLTAGNRGTRGTHLVVVDQLEELFTRSPEGRRERVEAFAANLRDMVENGSGKLRVLATVRADFIDRCLGLDSMRALLQDRSVLLGPMTLDDYRDAIVRPAATVGAHLETGVVSAFIRELERQPGALPLLEHALDQLWRTRKGVWLTLDSYEAMGGLKGALQKHADECLKGLTDEDVAVARDIFLRLVSLGEGVPDTRRRVPREDLYAFGDRQDRVDRIIEHLSGPKARLLMVDRGSNGQSPEVEVSHEILIQEWPTLRRWVDGERRKLRIHRRVNDAAYEWAAHRRAEGFLLTGARLLEPEEHLLGPGTSRARPLNKLEEEFLLSSMEARVKEVYQKDERRRRELEAVQRLADSEAAQRREMEQINQQLYQAMHDQAQHDMEVQISMAELNKLLFHERNLARSRELAGAALRELRSDPQAALLLLQSAFRAAPTEMVDEGLRQYHQYPGRVTLKGHSASVTSAAFNRGGQRVVTASLDGTARIWDAAAGTELLKLEGHSGVVLCACFSPDGSRVLTAGDDDTARLWDAASGRGLAVMEGHSGAVRSAAFSPDGQVVATASEDRTVRLWDAASGRELARLKGHSGVVLGVEFSPNGHRLVTASQDRTARTWNAIRHKELAVMKGHSGMVNSAGFSPDGEKVVTGSDDGTVRFWEAASGKSLERWENHSGAVMSASFSPNGRWVVTAGEYGSPHVWDAASHRELARLEGHSSQVMGAAFSADGLRVVTAGRDGTARLWDANSRRGIASVRHSGEVSSVTFSPDGTVLVTAGEDGTTRLWDTDSRRELGRLEGAGVVMSVAFSPGRMELLTAGEDGTVRLWEVATRREVARLEGHSSCVWSAAFSPDGTRLVTAGHDETVRLWDRAGCEETGRLVGHAGEAFSVAFNPDGRLVVTAGQDGTARIWDAAARQELARLDGHRGAVHGAAFSQDGQRLVTTCQDGTVRIWDAATWGELYKLESHLGAVWAAAFSPDGQRLATAGQDGTARVWDVCTGRELNKLEGPSGALFNIAFSPDGRRLVTAGEDGRAHLFPSWIWEPADERLLELEVGRSFTPEERRRLLHE